MQTVDVSKRSHKYETDYFTTFKSIIRYCNDKGFPITMADKDLGIVNTDYNENVDLPLSLGRSQRVKLNFSIKRLSDVETNVVIIASAEYEGMHGSWIQTPMTENHAVELFQQIFDGINSSIEN
jgi:hypothetical protein